MSPNNIEDLESSQIYIYIYIYIYILREREREREKERDKKRERESGEYVCVCFLTDASQVLFLGLFFCSTCLTPRGDFNRSSAQISWKFMHHTSLIFAYTYINSPQFVQMKLDRDKQVCLAYIEPHFSEQHIIQCVIMRKGSAHLIYCYIRKHRMFRKKKKWKRKRKKLMVNRRLIVIPI